ncbi:MAG: GNAT family N-acetyltransferase [Acidobacteria bacterium]|nr:GNAT family N-acetyltransferase [Acidobacteriota bacterium]
MRYRCLWREAAPPEQELVRILSPWIYEANQPFADWFFGDPHVGAEITAEWAARPTSESYVGRAVVQFDEDTARPAGCLISMSGADLVRCRSADFAEFCEELGPGPEADKIVGEVIGYSRELFPAVASTDLYVSRVAVDPAQRGRGFGRQLVTYATGARRADGFRTCRLDVSADNLGAIATYRACGWVEGPVSRAEGPGLAYRMMTLALR